MTPPIIISPHVKNINRFRYWRAAVGTINIFYVLLSGFILLAIFAPLILPRPFYVDWVNHVWIINYFCQHLSRHFDFPLMIDAVEAAGNAAPIFYGFLFYPIFSLFAFVLGPDLSIRVAAIVVLGAHAFLYYKMLRKAFPPTTSIIFATICMSSVYQMTNLYNRSALTEFFSHEFMTICIPLFFFAVFSEDNIKTGLFISALGIGIGAVGMHPPTAYSTAIFLGPALIIMLAALGKANRPKVKLIHVTAVAAACCVTGPWLYLVGQSAALLAISNDPSHVAGVIYFPTTIDSFAAKLWPAYIDLRTQADGIDQTSTPFLNASLQIPMILAVLTLVITTWSSACRSYRLAAQVLLMTCAIAIFLSFPPHQIMLVDSNEVSGYSKIVPEGLSVLYDVIQPLQFAYRLTNTISLQISTLLVFTLVTIARSEKVFAKTPAILPALLLLSTVTILLQVQSIFTEYNFRGPRFGLGEGQTKLNEKILSYSWTSYQHQVNNVDNYPDVFYGHGNYAMPSTFKVKDFAMNPSPWVLANFVESRSTSFVMVNCPSLCMVQTNLLPSIFVRLLVDDVQVPNERIASVSGRLSFMASAGEHKVKYEQVGRTLFAFRIARWIAVFWFVSALLYLGIMLLGRRRTFRNCRLFAPAKLGQPE